MRAVIFTGPTLPPGDAAAIVDAEYRPPAAIGDVYRAALTRPWAIGIIDGFFESTPSVWHREVLWAMAEGIHVFGAASMGALRAAELAAFGMVGVGRIFEDYRDGIIEDDDEVAVVHGPPEVGYVQLSEAMVNIRATLAKAAAARVISPASAERLIAIGKSLFYKQRNYERLLADAAEAGLPGAEIAGLRAWIGTNQVNQKRLDAEALLRAMDAARAAANEPMRARYRFERTSSWEAVERQFAPAHAPGEDAAATAIDREDLLDELRLEGESHARAKAHALVRLLARREADRQGMQPSIAALQEETRAFRKRWRFATPQELEKWLAMQGLDRAAFLRLMSDEACVSWLESALGDALDAALPDGLRLSGEHARLAARARDKRAVLSAHGNAEPSMADAGVGEAELVDWFQTESCGATDDLEEEARRRGFADARDLLRALVREYCYRRWKEAE